MERPQPVPSEPGRPPHSFHSERHGGHARRQDGLGAIELPPGGTVWQLASGVDPDPEAAARQRFAPAVGATLSAVGMAGHYVFAGTTDGRIFMSVDSGATFRPTTMPARAAGPALRILVDESGMALAVLGGQGARVLRTITGNFWDVLDGNLPDGAAHAIAADRAAGAVYVATDRGVFFGRADLMNASVPAVNWTSLTTKLPDAPAADVRLDPAGVQLYIALDGYGVYAAAAPHRIRNLRIVNAGDFTARPAAPGSLLSVVGARVEFRRRGGPELPRARRRRHRIPDPGSLRSRRTERLARAANPDRRRHARYPRSSRFARHHGQSRRRPDALGCR